MTKQAFIHELKTALSQVSESVRDEIISDISEHFTVGISQGLSEEDICRSLGQPGTIAAQVLEETGSLPQQHSYSTSQANHKGDIDMTFAGISSVRAELEASKLKFLPSHNGEFRVVFQGATSDDTCIAENLNGVLFVSVKPKQNRLFGIRLFAGKANVETTIYVPSQFMGELKAKSAAGSISATDTTGDLVLDTAAGSIKVNGHSCAKARIRSAAGSIKLYLADKFISEADVSSAAGSVTLEARETGWLDVKSAAGSVKVNVNKLGGNTKIKSAAGSVHLKANEVAGDIDIDSSMGSINVHLPADIDLHIDIIKHGMGSIRNNLHGNRHAKHTLRATSSMGSVNINPL